MAATPPAGQTSPCAAAGSPQLAPSTRCNCSNITSIAPCQASVLGSRHQPSGLQARGMAPAMMPTAGSPPRSWGQSKFKCMHVHIDETSTASDLL
jgi:hypothetical protein